jgi:hypothetical protein
MTEEEWLVSNAVEMIKPLLKRMSQRKWRLFCYALCRSIWDQMADERSHRAVEVTELLADGSTTTGHVLRKLLCRFVIAHARRVP